VQQVGGAAATVFAAICGSSEVGLQRNSPAGLMGLGWDGESTGMFLLGCCCVASATGPRLQYEL